MFAVRNPIWAKIQDRKSFILSMIESFPYMRKAYEEKSLSEIEQIAQKIADGDKEIEDSIRSQYRNCFYDCQDYENSFLQAMLIMVYSYYENCANLIKNEICTNSNDGQAKGKSDVVTYVCDVKNVNLPCNIKDDKSFLYEKVRELRNFLVHNNTTEPKTETQREQIRLITQTYPEIRYEDNEIYIVDKKCIIDILEKEYRVLRHICQTIGIC
jgi:hypothetical protein